MNGFSPVTRDAVAPRTRDKIQEPPMYKLLLHNDDYTTMEFVVEVLMGVCHKSFEDATRIMMSVHRTGLGVCGIYTYEIAETKSETIHEMAKDRGFPLKSSVEKA
ncbi:MAG: ATP-dependent Clp protease adaptor ClpS [Desulfosalsimonadaceae bacterium]|nr:ATP-dependent Clp protease adaptor ClpS [Desulfosalsimonadaceae bacterium]